MIFLNALDEFAHYLLPGRKAILAAPDRTIREAAPISALIIVCLFVANLPVEEPRASSNSPRSTLNSS